MSLDIYGNQYKHLEIPCRNGGWKQQDEEVHQLLGGQLPAALFVEPGMDDRRQDVVRRVLPLLLDDVPRIVRDLAQILPGDDVFALRFDPIVDPVAQHRAVFLRYAQDDADRLQRQFSRVMTDEIEPLTLREGVDQAVGAPP